MTSSNTSAPTNTIEHLSGLPNLLCSLIADPDGELAKQLKPREGSSSSSAVANGSTFLSASNISRSVLKQQINAFLDQLGGPSAYDDVLIVPPDFTRFPSHSGIITEMVAEYYNQIPSSSSSPPTTTPAKPSNFQILPALGTHAPMTATEIRKMFGSRLADKHETTVEGNSSDGNSDPLFVVHDWRNSVETIGHVEAKLVTDATHGMIQDQEWPAQLNTLVWSKRNELCQASTATEESASSPSGVGSMKSLPNLIISIGQVVPHEVLGMANYNKNLFVGVGGMQAINLSHFIGAVHGMEKLMGRGQNPLRHILNVASQKFLRSPQDIHLWYILTVIGSADDDDDDEDPKDGKNSTVALAQQPPHVNMRGLFIGNDIACYNEACELSLQLNFILLSKEPKRMVVYLDPSEFHSTWLGNKAIYRTRMAIADQGQLIILAPGICKFGEDDQIDVLIRKYGYVGTKRILDCMKEEDDDPNNAKKDPAMSLRNNLSAVAHMIHGSTEGRFNVTYCPGRLTKEEVEGVGFQYDDVNMLIKEEYDIAKLQSGWNVHPKTGEELYFIKNPALGLWAVPSRFNDDDSDGGKNNGDGQK
mmetsp:Transcript_24791/g.69613  ORF Transcript_24791/g.69613 Transcript_24791/m.69613 type:complete len:589 (-) Transcript_24791:72-1838(-)